MKIPYPVDLSALIAYRAVQYAQNYGYERGWGSSVQGLVPIYDMGMAGIHTEVPYLMYVEKGTKARLMTQLEGKVIPMPMPDGTTRFVKVKGVGQPGWVTLPDGVRVFRDQKWRYPGTKPQNFMANSLKKAILDSESDIQQMLMAIIQGQY